METKIIVNVSNGYDVAVGMSLYVNSFSNPGRRFYDAMRKASVRVQHNFTILCFEWFQALANLKDYDERNEASVAFAKKLPIAVRYDHLSKYKLSAHGIEEEFIFDYKDDGSAAVMLEHYLRMCEDNDAFILEMLRTHRTLQQNFSRLCCEWFRAILDMPEQNKPYVPLAKKAAAYYKGFPMI